MTPTERDTIAYTLDKFQPDYQGPFQNWTDQYLKLCICIDDFMYIYIGFYWQWNIDKIHMSKKYKQKQVQCIIEDIYMYKIEG